MPGGEVGGADVPDRSPLLRIQAGPEEPRMNRQPGPLCDLLVRQAIHDLVQFRFARSPEQGRSVAKEPFQQLIRFSAAQRSPEQEITAAGKRAGIDCLPSTILFRKGGYLGARADVDQQRLAQVAHRAQEAGLIVAERARDRDAVPRASDHLAGLSRLRQIRRIDTGLAERLRVERQRIRPVHTQSGRIRRIHRRLRPTRVQQHPADGRRSDVQSDEFHGAPAPIPVHLPNLRSPLARAGPQDHDKSSSPVCHPRSGGFPAFVAS